MRSTSGTVNVVVPLTAYASPEPDVNGSKYAM
jgi:hypothetical protein